MDAINRTTKELFKFSRNEPRMAVLVDLDHHVADAFEKACGQLLAMEGSELLVDLGQIGYICSTCLGAIILANDQAMATGRKLRVKIPESLVTVFDLMSMRELMETEVVG